MPDKVRVLVATVVHLYKLPNGVCYTPSVYGYDFFCRYLNVFDEVKVVARTKYVNEIDENKFIKISGDGVVINEIPYYHGMKDMMSKIFSIIRSVRHASDGCDCIIYRLPLMESYLTYVFGNNHGKPYSIEAVADPLGWIFVTGIFKNINVWMMRHIIAKANGAAYVTNRYLQNLYPNSAMKNGESCKYFQSHYSSIDLCKDDIVSSRQNFYEDNNLKLVHVSNTMENNSKGIEEFIEVIVELANKGYQATGYIIGNGGALPYFKSYAEKLGVLDRINFIGKLSTKREVFSWLLKSDVMLFPSRSEGLPRCVIEAGACGLPVLSTPVSGIPEILDKKYLFDPEDVKGFTDMLIHLIENPAELEEMSRRNIEMAKEFTKDKLQKRRDEFYLKLRKLAEENKCRK